MIPKTTIIHQLHPSRLFYTSVFGVIVGIVIATLTHVSFFSASLWLAPAFILLYLSLSRPSTLTIPLAFLAGVIFGNLRLTPELAGRELLESKIGQNLTISGSLAASPTHDQGSTSFQLKNLHLFVARAGPDSSSPPELESVPGTLYVKVSGTPDLNRSDEVVLSGRLSAGFGTFTGSLYRPEVISITRPDPGDIFIKLKDHFSTLVEQYIPSPASGLGLGYLMGDKSDLSEQFSDSLRAVGMTHVVVASGAHLSIIVNIVKKVFGRISKFASLTGGILAVLAFAMIVGFTPSMTRAALVVILSLLVGYVGRRFSPLCLISLVAMITLLIAPTNLLSLGWQLSFSSFFGILIIAPSLVRLLYGGKRPPWLANMLITSLATTIACAPILIYSFGTISLLAFAANLLILPTLPYAMLLVFLTGASSFWPLLAELVGRLAQLLLDFHIWVIEFLSTKSMFILNFEPGHLMSFLLYLPVLAILCYNIIYDKKCKLRSNHQDRARNVRLC